MRGEFFNLQVEDLEEVLIEKHAKPGRWVSILEQKADIKQGIRHEKDIILGMISSKDLGGGVDLSEVRKILKINFNQYRPDLGQFVFDELYHELNKDGEIYSPGMDLWKVVP